MFTTILDKAVSPQRIPYGAILELDKRLHDAYDSAHPYLKIRSMDEPNTKSPNIIIRRYGFNMLFHESQCVFIETNMPKKDQIRITCTLCAYVSTRPW